MIGTRPTFWPRLLRFAAAISVVADLSGCSVLSLHRFSALTSEWQTRTGQLLYRNRRTTIVGDVVVRTSRAGDYELTFSKGPGVPLLSIQQDASFARVKGALSKIGWAGPVAHAPPQLRGWLALREKIIAAQNQPSVQFKQDGETFIVHF